MKRIGFIISLVILALGACSPYEEKIETANLNDNFLTDYFVTSITFDNENTAWIGTFDQGLIRYKGKDITIYDENSTPFLDSVWIRDIDIDSKGNIWLAANGLIKFDGENFTKVRNEKDSESLSYITDIEIDQSDKIWIASPESREGYIPTLDINGSDWALSDTYEIPSEIIGSIAIDSKNTVWLALSQYVNNNYLIRIKDGVVNTYTEKELGFSPYSIRDIDTDSEGNLWAIIDYSLSSSIMEGQPVAFKFNGETCTTFTKEEMQNNPSIANLVSIDAYDNVWIGNFKEVNVLQNGQWIANFSTPNEASIYTIAHHPESNEVWLGTAKGIWTYNIDFK